MQSFRVDDGDWFRPIISRAPSSLLCLLCSMRIVWLIAREAGKRRGFAWLGATFLAAAPTAARGASPQLPAVAVVTAARQSTAAAARMACPAAPRQRRLDAQVLALTLCLLRSRCCDDTGPGREVVGRRGLPAATRDASLSRRCARAMRLSALLLFPPSPCASSWSPHRIHSFTFDLLRRTRCLFFVAHLCASVLLSWVCEVCEDRA